MTIDISKIRPGDEVDIRFVVQVVDQNAAWPHVECRPGDLDGGICDSDYVSAGVAAIVSHTPKELQPGDRVRPVGGHDGGRVLASDGEFVWVQMDGRDGPNTYGADELERV